MRVGYRAGPVNKKTEFQSQFSYGSRSTGYHGTGYYFCTKIENVVGLNQGDRPIYKLTFKDGLKWLTGTIETHDSLKLISRYVYNFELIQHLEELKRIWFYAKGLTFYNTDIFNSIKESYEAWNDGKSFLNWLNEDTYREKNFVDSLKDCELTKKFYYEIIKENPDWKKLSEWEKESDCFDFDYIDSLKDLNFKVENFLPIRLNTTFDFIKEFAENHQNYHEEHRYDEADSIMTVFLKELGYDGVWPSAEIDDTTYGGVIFEKENIANIELILEKGKDYIKENCMSRNEESLERIFSVVDRNNKPIKSSVNMDDIYDKVKNTVDIEHFKSFGGDNEWEGVEVREALASNDLINDPDFNGEDATEEDDRLVDEMTYRLHKEVWGDEKPYKRIYSSKTLESEVIKEMYADDGCLIQILKLPDGKYKVTDNWQTADICDNLHDAEVLFNDYLG